MIPISMIWFRNGAFTLDDAQRTLAAHPLTVQRNSDFLTVRWEDGPILTIRFQSGEAVRHEAIAIGSTSAFATDLSNCDARFEITFDSLDEVLEEINTLIDVQLTLQDATRGILFNSWNQLLTPPEPK